MTPSTTHMKPVRRISLTLNRRDALRAGLARWRAGTITLREALTYTGPTFEHYPMTYNIGPVSRTFHVRLAAQGDTPTVEYIYPLHTLKRIRLEPL